MISLYSTAISSTITVIMIIAVECVIGWCATNDYHTRCRGVCCVCRTIVCRSIGIDGTFLCVHHAYVRAHFDKNRNKNIILNYTLEKRHEGISNVERKYSHPIIIITIIWVVGVVVVVVILVIGIVMDTGSSNNSQSWLSSIRMYHPSPSSIHVISIESQSVFHFSMKQCQCE